MKEVKEDDDSSATSDQGEMVDDSDDSVMDLKEASEDDDDVEMAQSLLDKAEAKLSKARQLRPRKKKDEMKVA